MKPAVRYIIRAVKYFCWFAILFTLIISVLAFTKFVPTENGVEGLFIHGWKSILEICGVFLVFSALYPKFGYQKRQVSIPREFDTLKSKIFDRVRSELFFLSNLFSIFVVYISKYRKYETFN